MFFQEFIAKFEDFENQLKKLPVGLFGDLRLKPFRIVVVGGVGVGKSSVIERIIKVRLPKGKDGCTRRPVIIPLALSEPLGCSEEEVKMIEKIPLVLNEEAPIEFVDLPGLTGMPRPDQPFEYPQMTQELFDDYVQSADLILLCLPADADFVNSDALRRLQQLEIPENKIIGAISKVDLLEEPAKIDLEIASTFGAVVLLRNAPNLEIDEPIDVVEKKEAEFFKSFQTTYSTGIENLKREILRLSNVWLERKRNEIVLRFLKEETRLRNRLTYLLDPNISLTIVLSYIERVSKELNTAESVNSRLNWLFWNVLPESFDSIDPLEGLNRDQLRILLKNSQGLNASLHGIDSAFKVLLKGQLCLSERIINECLMFVLKELREILLVKPVDYNEEKINTSCTEDIETFESVDEFYDVRSVSDSEDSDLDADDVFQDELKLLPSLSTQINESVSNLLESSYEITRKYLDDYCAMQRELIFCRDSRYLEAFKQYDRMTLMRSSESINNSNNNNSVPMSRIDSESLESVDLKPPRKQEDSGFIKELLDLLFPSGGGNKMKRVEYRPRAFKPTLKAMDLGNENENRFYSMYNGMNNINLNISNVSNALNHDEEFLLKLLEIYLTSYHRQLSDFLPKCLNFHLIQRIIKGLPTALLNRISVNSEEAKNEKIGRERGKIERILKLIEEIKALRFPQFMSTGGPNTQRFSPFTPPLRGSFPLDRDHICNPLVEDYLNCLRDYNRRPSASEPAKENDVNESGSEICRPLARKYLECRMKAGLMTEEDLKSLGY